MRNAINLIIIMSIGFSSILTGVSGEYFAAAELSRRGYVASITLRNTKGIDIDKFCIKVGCNIFKIRMI